MYIYNVELMHKMTCLCHFIDTTPCVTLRYLAEVARLPLIIICSAGSCRYFSQASCRLGTG